VYRYEPSQADVTTFQALGKAPASSFPHALRWYNHIKSFGSETSKFPGAKSAAAAPASKPADDDDDDVDLFGSDDEEVPRNPGANRFFHGKIPQLISINKHFRCRMRLLRRSRQTELKPTVKRNPRNLRLFPSPQLS
jgi:hypothetical protein